MNEKQPMKPNAPITEAPHEQRDLKSTDKTLSSEQAHQETGRILLADDYKPNQDVARIHLEKAGHSVVTADDGMAVLEACKNEKFDLIMLDVQMPTMDGIEAAQRIRAGSSPSARAPILALTAHADPALIEDCLTAGMNGVITKPFLRHSLLEAVNEWLRADPKKPMPRPAPTDEQENAHAQPCDASPLDYERALYEFNGNKELLDSLIEYLVEELRKKLPALEEAANKGDIETIRKEAHKLKGGAASLTANAVAQCCRTLEAAAADNQMNQIRDALRDLETRFKALERSRDHQTNYDSIVTRNDKSP